MRMTFSRPSPTACFSDDRRGNVLIEFAFTAPIVLALGLYGIELGNQALVNMRISQIALNLADNASRSGQILSSNVEQLREGDINDVLRAAKLQGASFNLTTNGRITISSLENVRQDYDLVPLQRIHWQRCIGAKTGVDYVSHYGSTTTAAGSTNDASNAGELKPLGMGKAGALVNAPIGTGVIFVEINYLYQPTTPWLTQPHVINYTASMIVRNNRDFRQIYNPVNSATAATCNKFTT
jgi:Flp pilus assembly protein TadG